MRRGAWAEYDRECRSEDSEFVYSYYDSDIHRVLLVIHAFFVPVCVCHYMSVVDVASTASWAAGCFVDVSFSFPSSLQVWSKSPVALLNTIIDAVTNDGPRAMLFPLRTLFFASTQWLLYIAGRVFLYFNDS